jgi:hypothetical protein
VKECLVDYYGRIKKVQATRSNKKLRAILKMKKLVLFTLLVACGGAAAAQQKKGSTTTVLGSGGVIIKANGDKVLCPTLNYTTCAIIRTNVAEAIAVGATVEVTTGQSGFSGVVTEVLGNPSIGGNVSIR